MDWDEQARVVAEDHVTIDEDHSSCPNSNSVMGLAVACAVLVVLYVCTVFCICLKRSNSSIAAKVSLPPEHIPGRSTTNSSISNFGLMPTDYVR